MIGICKICKCLKFSIKTRHRNTCYEDKSSNYLKACKDCQALDDQYFNERWEEFYGSRGV